MPSLRSDKDHAVNEINNRSKGSPSSGGVAGKTTPKGAAVACKEGPLI